MKARAVCVPMGRPLVANSLLWVVLLIFSFAALLLTSCTNSANPEQKPLSCQAATATQPHDYAYQYFDADTTTIPTNGIRRFAGNDDYATACITSVEEMRSLTNVPTQTFAIKNKKDTVITGKKGIKVHIPANCFTTQNPNAEVKIILKEYNSPTDLFFANLTTNSNGQMLESGGTVYINAMSDGQLMGLKKGKKIALAFPTGKAKPGMQTFYGQKKADGSINWQTTTNSGNTNGIANLFNTTNNTTNRIRWRSEKVLKTGYKQRTSTLTGWKFQIQAYGSNDHCTRFTDTSEYKNVLEYFMANFTVSPHDFKTLQGSYFTYYYTVDNTGDVTKKPILRLEFHAKTSVFTKKLKKQTVIKLKEQIVKLLKEMPRAEPTHYGKQEIIRVYINQFNTCKNGPALKINDNKVKKDYWDVVWHPDTVDAATYQAWVDSTNAANKARHDSLIKTDAEYYFLNSGQLGWINCDRFYDNGKPKRSIIVKADDKPNLVVKVVFKDIMSLMPLYSNGNTGVYTAGCIPMGEAVRYVLIDKRPDGLYYAVKDGTTSTEKVTGFEFKPMTMEAIKKELASL